MDTTEFVTLAILAEGGEICGKTKLQKTIYFLGIKTGCLNDLGYRPHFYGPYSDEVANAVTTLRTIGAIDQHCTDWGCNKSGFEVRRYDYRLNEQGKQFAESKASQNPDLYEQLKEAVKALKKAGDPDYMAMSVAAKTYFMRKKGGPTDAEDLSRLANTFGWKVTPEQITKAANYLSNLNLDEQ